MSCFTESATQEVVQAPKQNIIQSGAFYLMKLLMLQGNALKMIAKIILKPDGLTYFISDSTSDVQLKQ